MSLNNLEPTIKQKRQHSNSNNVNDTVPLKRSSNRLQTYANDDYQPIPTPPAQAPPSSSNFSSTAFNPQQSNMLPSSAGTQQTDLQSSQNAYSLPGSSSSRTGQQHEQLIDPKSSHSSSDRSIQNAPASVPAPAISREEQRLIANLQEIYKVIIKNENELISSCAAITNSNAQQPMDLSNVDMSKLWVLYNLNMNLLNHYLDFIIQSLNSSNINSGLQIIKIYRILKRLWIYGVVTFLDVLKNIISLFIEHDICSNFISHAFNILTSLLSVTNLNSDSWIYERLGDLSRMAIALYPSKFIDWKLSSEFWYLQSIKLQYGNGKTYYHISTVQSDSLDALVSLGKSAFCHDIFIPSNQYMDMVLVNILNRNTFNYSQYPIIDFIQINKDSISNQLSQYDLFKSILIFLKKFGVDPNENDELFFTRFPNHAVLEDFAKARNPNYENKALFWFQKSSSFAIVNILQMCGFGNYLNPFAKLFGLVKCINMKKTTKRTNNGNNPVDEANLIPDSEWSEAEWEANSVMHLNRTTVYLSMKMFEIYLAGPIVVGLPYTLIMLYFLISVGETMKEHPNSIPFFSKFIPRIIPLNMLIDYLNTLLNYYKVKYNNHEPLDPSLWVQLQKFNSNETLSEVWKCWGTLWFDKISKKDTYDDYSQVGLSNQDDLINYPTYGELYDSNLNSDRMLRVLTCALYIADNFEFGLKRDGSKFGTNITTTFTSEEMFQLNFEPLDLSRNYIHEPVSGNYNQFFQSGADESLVEDEQSDNSDVNLNEYHIVFDSNIWVKHCGKIYKCLKSKIFSNIIPLIIFQELRSLRNSKDISISECSTRCVITLRQLFNEFAIKAINLKGDYVLNINDLKDFEENNEIFKTNNIDDLIIQSIINKNQREFMSINDPTVVKFRRKPTILITDDKNLRIKCKMLNVDSFSATWFWENMNKISNGKCNN
ncbi:hypothetical protein WICPIJ_007069 [Wickerhamomyces pijperi]|uniref:PIN domain-containing protein n=1 Tax=Wickerhamomyces pijperi TaxID=599730 RepID=A0A9P8TKT3_WICPI|nr:hypothetical protein WICPIJ_007069 [Wickerhamomyces pijperi]